VRTDPSLVASIAPSEALAGRLGPSLRGLDLVEQDERLVDAVGDLAQRRGLVDLGEDLPEVRHDLVRRVRVHVRHLLAVVAHGGQRGAREALGLADLGVGLAGIALALGLVVPAVLLDCRTVSA